MKGSPVRGRQRYDGWNQRGKDCGDFSLREGLPENKTSPQVDIHIENERREPGRLPGRRGSVCDQEESGKAESAGKLTPPGRQRRQLWGRQVTRWENDLNGS